MPQSDSRWRRSLHCGTNSTNRSGKCARERRLARVCGCSRARASRLALAGLALGAAALIWRATTPRPAEVAVIPFEAIKSVMPTPTPVAAASPEVKVFPPPPEAAVSVVRKGVTGGANGHGPEIIDVGEALGRTAAVAADSRLVGNSKYGLLPRIAADGARPSAVYARPFAETPVNRGAPRIAVLVGGVGLDPQTTDAAIARLPAAVSLGLAPYGPDSARSRRGRARRGTKSGCRRRWRASPAAEPGPHTLRTDASLDARTRTRCAG